MRKLEINACFQQQLMIIFMYLYSTNCKSFPLEYIPKSVLYFHSSKVFFEKVLLLKGQHYRLAYR